MEAGCETNTAPAAEVDTAEAAGMGLTNLETSGSGEATQEGSGDMGSSTSNTIDTNCTAKGSNKSEAGILVKTTNNTNGQGKITSLENNKDNNATDSKNLSSSTSETVSSGASSEQISSSSEQPLSSKSDTDKICDKTEVVDTSVTMATDDKNVNKIPVSNGSNKQPADAIASKIGQDNATENGPEKVVRYKCPKCLRVMKDKRLIDNHSCDSEVEEEKVKITITMDKDKKCLVCKECDFSSTGHGFEEHLMCHLMIRPYQCLYCKECFINRKEISRHVHKSHNGAKMSCALRALRKAKALIKEVTTAGIISFMAKVAGKVPLEKDPDKKRKPDGVQISEAGGSAEEPAKAPVEEKTESVDKVDESSAGKPDAGVVNEGEAIEKQPKSQGFSKLRQVLTAEPDVALINNQGEASKNTKVSTDVSGLKIVAAYSLNEAPATDKAESSESVEPNFFIEPSKETENEPEVLSFLGPEQPLYKSDPSTSTLMLPPPPLLPAPTHASSQLCAQQPQAASPQAKNSNFFICGFNCLFTSMITTDFKEHTVNFHSSEAYFPCYYCGHRSPNENDLVRHISNHTHTHNKTSPLYVCGNDSCRFGTNMLTDYINHIKVAHSEIVEPLCYSCGEIFPDLNMLQTHVEENVIHSINCPHCPSKATERKAILNHISTVHPGKAKMVSVAKQLICNDRKVNNYEQMKHLREMLPPTLTPAPVFASDGTAHTSVVDQILSRHELSSDYNKSGSLSEILASTSSPRGTPSPTPKKRERTPESGHSPNSEGSDFGSIRVKDEIDDDIDDEMEGSGGTDEATTAYTIDENGIRRRIYVPMSERQAENYRCRYCTFIARDLKRLNCHERSHGMPPTRKERFKCMFCPQGFDSEMKFRLHITCHPGLIKFLLYRCKKCEFDTNQKHTIVKHITCNRDRKHRGFGPVEDQYTVVSRSLESRVLECERCSYMTRHKIHMAIHYQRKHNILRDKGEFTIEGLTPTDTPLSSYSTSPKDPSASPTSSVNLQSPDGYGNSLDGVFDFTKPSGSAKKAKDRSTPESPHLTVSQISERNELFNKMVSQQAALQPGQVLENQMRKFKCPICKYLLPKAADLKNHVKRHSEIGQITLIMFRCKYCSCMSTARELLYDHLNEKHPGKPIALVKKIVAIDTTEVDKSFAETSIVESLDQLEESLHKEIMTSLKNPTSSPSKSKTSYEQLFVIPEGGEVFNAPLQCPKCQFSSFKKTDIVEHVNSLHPEVKVISSDEDVDRLARATSEDLKKETEDAAAGGKNNKNSVTCQEEVLIVPDDQVFKEPALCSRCEFSTMLRRDMVLHLQQNHPDISVMGRNSYPVQVGTMGRKIGVIDESCVVGSGSLDAKIRCLYENYGTQMKCLICGTERPKKFFIHVHILRHLNIYLWKCAFCSHRGLQKYKMVDHIKKIHPGKAMSVRYIRVNVETKVAQFLAQFNIIKNRKATLDEGGEMPYTSPSYEDSMDQASSDSNMSRQKSPVPGGSSNNTLGSDELDEKLRCLYDFSDGVYYKCIACSNQFQRKFAVHRHIIITHLKVALLSCAYCGMEGVEKHQMVDHILACHKNSPVSIQTLHVDLGQKISEFLTKLASGELTGASVDNLDQTEINEIMHGLSSPTEAPEFEDNLYTNTFKPVALKKKGKILASKLSKFKTSNKTALNVVRKYNSVDPQVIMLGREALDVELNCLYQQRTTGQFSCLVCRWEFPRKYPLHRHIMLKHLKLNLVGCPYCPFEGVEKYNVSSHIKDEHRDMPINIKYSQPDVRKRVREFVTDMASLGGQTSVRDASSRESSPLLVPKVEKDDEEEEEQDEDAPHKVKSNGSHGGLVVAMFGKKKKTSPPTPSDDVVVKTEIDDGENGNNGSEIAAAEEEEQYDEEDEDANNFAEEDYNEEDDPGADPSNYNPEKPTKSFPPIKRKFKDSYAPGSYRSPAGGKPKALDVITKIKVLKAKEGPITKFYCEKCKFTSLHRSNIVRHIYKIHEKYQTHTCPVCNYQTLSLMLMQKHVEKEHPGVSYKEDAFSLNPPRSKPRSKPLMGPLSFQRKRQILISKKLASTPPVSAPSTNQGPKQYACAYCHYETNTQEDILHHTRENHSQSDENHTEKKSPKISMQASVKPLEEGSACWDGSKKAVKRKIKEDPEGSVFKRRKRFVFEKGDELFQCEHCDTRETSISRMQDHTTWDHPGMPYKAKRIPAWRFVCRSCAVKTMATSKMKYHLNRHVNYRPYTCTKCGAFFPSPDQCRRHSRSQGHEEQYTYVRNVKKENKVEELLEATRQLALRVQEEASRDPEFHISNTDAFISKFQDSSSNLKRSAPTGSKSSKKLKTQAHNEDSMADEEGLHPKKQHGKSLQTVGIELDVTVKCYYCDFTASNVHEVKQHHSVAHSEEKFLWTELDRGFTCDSTGEALPDCESVPSSSLDVGYTTRMTLGSGNSPMRFKCKTCDFSSCVIQAMKSHLKSHQPKGFICPYCSRSFSGKEKLMRHQYCLHKGQQLWVIHLRRCGVAGSTNTTKGKATGAVTKAIVPDDIDKPLVTEMNLKELSSNEKAAKRKNLTPLTYLCHECPYTSESLYHYRLHIAQQHEEYTYTFHDASINTPLHCIHCSFRAETEAEFNSHMEEHDNSKNFKCGYCDFVSVDKASVQQHLTSKHPKLKCEITDLDYQSQLGSKLFKGQQKRDLPLLLNISPQVALIRIPDEILNAYCSFDEMEYAIGEEEDEEEMSDVDESNPRTVVSVLGVDAEDSRSLFAGEDSHEMDDSSLHDDDDISSDKDMDDDMEEDRSSTDLNMLHVNESSVGSRDQESLGSEMMIMQFGGVDTENCDLSMQNSIGASLMRSKDSTLLSAQQDDDQSYDKDQDVAVSEEDEEEDDVDEVSFENDITLASPLPMISLSDGVGMSPNHLGEEDENSTSSHANSNSEMLLDV